MILTFKAEKIEITIERSISLRSHPAFAYKADNYNIKLDAEQLVGAFGDVVKRALELHNELNKAAKTDENFDIPEMSEQEFAQSKYADDLATTLEARRDGNGQA